MCLTTSSSTARLLLRKITVANDTWKSSVVKQNCNPTWTPEDVHDFVVPFLEKTIFFVRNSLFLCCLVFWGAWLAVEHVKVFKHSIVFYSYIVP